MKIGSIILFVRNMKAVTEFYRNVLGLRPDKDQPFPPNKFFRFSTGSCKLCLHSASKPNGGRQKVVFHVPSVRSVHESLKSKGLRLRPLKNEGGLACFDVSDPEGNRIQIWGIY
jgi:catechol 2,3-dioxygenase-like lactoylglutathione lyase family enzyme